MRTRNARKRAKDFVRAAKLLARWARRKTKRPNRAKQTRRRQTARRGFFTKLRRSLGIRNREAGLNQSHMRILRAGTPTYHTAHGVVACVFVRFGRNRLGQTVAFWDLNAADRFGNAYVTRYMYAVVRGEAAEVHRFKSRLKK